MTDMPVSVDGTRCVESGDCALVAPDTFEVNEDEGVARVLPTAAHAARGRLEGAARECPTGATALTPST